MCVFTRQQERSSRDLCVKKKTIRVVQKLVEKSVRRFTQDLATSAFPNSGLAFDLEAVQPPFFQCISGEV